MSDLVKAPKHYEGDGVITAKDAMRSMMSNANTYMLDREECSYEIIPQSAFYWWGCAFKYVWRWSHKNGVQDIDKAIECLTELRKAVACERNRSS